MKAVILPHKESLYAKAAYWCRLVAITGGAQVVVQGAGLLTSILIIRLLPTREYAYYTLANTVLGVMTMLSDGGISNGVLSRGGKVWQDKTKLGVVLASGLALRRQFALVALMVGCTSLIFLLFRNGADWLTTVSIVIALLPSFWAALSDSLLEVIPKLHQEIKLLQKNQVLVGIGRLAIAGICLPVIPLGWVAILVNGLIRAYGNIKLLGIAHLFVDKEAKPEKAVKGEIVNVVKRVMPITLYYCLSSQLIIWIPSLLGNVSGVAQIGALSRLSMVLNLVSMLITTLISPRFARIDTKNHSLVIQSFIYVQFALLGICVAVFTLFALFPDQFLWLIGKSYTGLNEQLLLMIASNCIGLVASTTGNIIASRGWYINPILIIVTNLFSLIISIYVFNLSTVVGVLYYTILLNTATYIITLGYGFTSLLRFSHEKN